MSMLAYHVIFSNSLHANFVIPRYFYNGMPTSLCSGINGFLSLLNFFFILVFIQVCLVIPRYFYTYINNNCFLCGTELYIQPCNCVKLIFLPSYHCEKPSVVSLYNIYSPKLMVPVFKVMIIFYQRNSVYYFNIYPLTYDSLVPNVANILFCS